MQEFDKAYWERHWAGADRDRSLSTNPHLPVETAGLAVGTALDAGCGGGAEVLWLAERGWRVTGADISATALSAAAHRVEKAGRGHDVEWIEADLTAWEPGRVWDLVVTGYAHPDTGQLAFYERIGSWVAPGGTLLIVGHLHGSGHGAAHPEDATVTSGSITGLFTEPDWHIGAAYESARTVRHGEHPVRLRDVVVRAHRNG